MIVTRITTTVSGESKIIQSEASESMQDNNSQDEENININAVSDATVSGLPEDQEQEGQQQRQLNSLEDHQDDEEEAEEPSASSSSSESVKEEQVRR